MLPSSATRALLCENVLAKNPRMGSMRTQPGINFIGCNIPILTTEYIRNAIVFTGTVANIVLSVWVKVGCGVSKHLKYVLA